MVQPPTNRRTRLIDETGHVYGHLAVLHRAPCGGSARWLCHCDCGKDVEIDGNRLRTSRLLGRQITHHGCPIAPNHKFVDLTGLVYGRFTVLRRSNGPDELRTYWLCRCACGVEVSVLSGSLRTGTSLGCAACGSLIGADKRRKYASREESAWRALYKAHRFRKSMHGHLDFQVWKVIVQQRCYYCHAEPTDRGLVAAHGVDRKINSEGYTPINSVPCCFRCNQAKSTHTVDSFLDLCRQVASAHPK